MRLPRMTVVACAALLLALHGDRASVSRADVAGLRQGAVERWDTHPPGSVERERAVGRLMATLKPGMTRQEVESIIGPASSPGAVERDGWGHVPIDNPEALFPRMAAILGDSNGAAWDIGQAFWIVGEAKGTDRRQFVPLAVARLADSDRTVRRAAVWCLGDIGGEREAACLVPLLSDEDSTIQYAAAKALAAIGGERELVALDAWLIAGAGRHRDPTSLKHVQECRDALQRRLSSVPKKL